MNTQPMDEYLNRERLTDLAQFAVPDGHDLWPKIERAARASSSSLATPRTGILSLGPLPRLDGSRNPPHSGNIRGPRLRTGSPRPLKWPRSSAGSSRHAYTRCGHSDTDTADALYILCDTDAADPAGRRQHASIV